MQRARRELDRRAGAGRRPGALALSPWLALVAVTIVFAASAAAGVNRGDTGTRTAPTQHIALAQCVGCPRESP